MKTMVALLGLLLVAVVAASLQAAPSQPAANPRQTTGEFSQWAQKHQTCACVISGYTFCMDASRCKACAGPCP
jgi:hypothetical protein